MRIISRGVSTRSIFKIKAIIKTETKFVL